MKAQPSKTWPDHLRMIWAITLKDIREAIRNKNVIAVLLSALFIIVMYRALPLLEQSVDPPLLRIYDAGESALVAFLENDPEIDVRAYTALEDMQAGLRHADLPQIGLAIPVGFDEALEAGAPPPLQGYVVNWVSSQRAADLQQFAEAKIAHLLGAPVNVDIAGNMVFLEPDSGGLGVTAGMALVFAVIMIGFTLIPHLMLEEKKQHTLEVLLVSPAGTAHVIAAKALTGLFYSLLGAATGLLIYANLVLHWWLALLAVLCGALFSVALGLLLGSMIEDRAQLTLIAWFFLMPLFFPLILFLLDDLLPAWLAPLMAVVPSTVMFNLLRSAFALNFAWREVWIGAVWLAGCALPGVRTGCLAPQPQGHPRRSASPIYWNRKCETYPPKSWRRHLLLPKANCHCERSEAIPAIGSWCVAYVSATG